MPKSNIFVTDLAGVVYEGRTVLMDPDKTRFAQKTEARKLADIIGGADVFLGLSAGGVLKPEMVKGMAAKPLILALANPTPEISPEEVKAVRDDAIMATGRTDYPNQVNNVLCFPYIFRGALDAGASTITPEMEVAAVHAIAELAQAEQSEVVAAAYAGETLAFGPEYLIPKPFDPRLMMKIAPAVVQAAIASGVAQRPIADMDAYREKLQSLVYASGAAMKPVFSAAKRGTRKRICFAEGEDERVLRAAQIVLDEAGAGDSNSAQARLELLEPLPLLEISSPVLAFAQKIINHGLLPIEADRDAAHIATATVHQLDALLSLNFRHLVNASIQGRLRRLAASEGYELPAICTPEELMDIN